MSSTHMRSVVGNFDQYRRRRRCAGPEFFAYRQARRRRRTWLPSPRTPVEGGQEVNAWLIIGSDDTVTIRVAQSEMGQVCLPRCR